MKQFPDSIQKLINTFLHLPGLGRKSSERIVFYLLKQNSDYIKELTDNINKLKSEIKICGQCGNVSALNPCDICKDTKRENSLLCIVSEPQDIMVIEKTGEYKGYYHVLGGVLNPIEGITPEKLNIDNLLQRIKNTKPSFKEVLIATNLDLEGESTAMYLARKLKPLNITITRLAKGLPVGSTIEYADEITISSALKGRQEV